MYIAEIAAARVRGVLASLRSLSFTLGVLICLATGVLCHWRWLAFIGAIPPTLVLILMIPMPQSPRWLLGKNRTDEALEVLLWLRGPEANIKEECSNIKDTLSNNLIHHPSRGSFFIGKEKTASEVEERGGGGRGGALTRCDIGRNFIKVQLANELN